MNHNHKYIFIQVSSKIYEAKFDYQIYEAKFDGKSWIIYHLNSQRCLNNRPVWSDTPANTLRKASRKTLRKSLIQTFGRFDKPKIYDNLQTLMEKEAHNLL